MSLVQVSDLRFCHGADVLFEGVTFRLGAGERAALVAPNGAGKSTLLRLIVGELRPDQGTVVVRKDARVGYYRQSHELVAEGSVLSAFLSTFREVIELRDALTAAQHEAATGDARALERLAAFQERYHVAEGDAIERDVTMLATRLGFTEADRARPVASLSGGERGRLHLGVVLASRPDLLLLDEPTNHLDLDTIDWLTNWLQGFRGALLVVSHDRAFLDAVTSETLELGSRGVRVYPVSYSSYVEARAADLARERAAVARQRQEVARTEEFIRRNIAGQKTKQAQSRRKMLEKLTLLERPEDVWADAERVAFRFAPAQRSGDVVLEARGLSACRGGRKLFSGVNLLVKRGERVGIVGPNGAGKTTLLRLLSGRAEPGDGGTVRRGTNLQEGYFDQHLGDVDPKLTAVEEVRRVRGDFTVEAARQYLARFRFWGDDPLRVVGGFSGGERARLSLAKLLLEPRNLLFLDEPTNHLDIPAAEILEEALVGFEGTVLLVSHDRRFLENVTTRIVSVRAGEVEVYPGGMGDFMASRERHARDESVCAPAAGSRSGPPPRSQGEDASVRRRAFEERRQQARDQDKKRRRVQDLERSIAEAERALSDLRARLRQAPGEDWEKLAVMAGEEQALQRRVDDQLQEWARLSEELS